MIPVCIRQAEKRDLIDLEWEGEYTHFRRLYADTFLMVEQGSAIIWIAELNGAGLVGQCFVSLRRNHREPITDPLKAYLYGFRVKTSYRNQGIGTQMVNTIELDLRKRKFQQITLNVSQENNKAKRFYERLGYAVVGTDPGYWSYIDDKGKRIDMHEPAWRMIKNLL
jgi:ribosomal protein S18 acetylase RimI-like enzyme